METQKQSNITIQNLLLFDQKEAKGHNNTKFFHKHAAYRKSYNTIWDFGWTKCNSSMQPTGKAIILPFKDNNTSTIGEIMSCQTFSQIFYEDDLNHGSKGHQK